MTDKLKKIQIYEEQFKYVEGHLEWQEVGEVISCFLYL